MGEILFLQNGDFCDDDCLARTELINDSSRSTSAFDVNVLVGSQRGWNENDKAEVCLVVMVLRQHRRIYHLLHADTKVEP